MRRRGEGGFRRRRRKMATADLDITPMIDVVFLLLIFFMVTSTMQGSPDQNVPPARHGIGVPTADALIIRLVKGEGAEPSMTIDGSGDAEFTLEELPGVVAERRNEFNSVIIKADRDVPAGYVRRAAQAVGNIEGVRFYVGVREHPRR